MMALMIAAATNAQSAQSPRAALTIVLVHGALIDGSSWRGVYDVLTKDGYRVSIVQPPLTGLEEDVAATKRVLDQVDGPVILVGNSYGGSIITVAGSDPKVKALVYVAALQPDVGETSAEAAPPMKSASNDLRPTAAWRDKPSYAIIATEDHSLDLGVARRMANRAGSLVTVIKGGHLIQISQARAVTRVIETAARAVK
jgi:pimeloyl-ACP methyl ester carboxylesterase